MNPVAGGGRAAHALPALRQFAQEERWPVEICVTQSANDLAEKARSATCQGYHRIFVLGGDGTFQILLNSVADHRDVVLGLIPAGGGNDLAASLGLPSDPVRAAKLLLHGEVSRIDAVRVRTGEGYDRFYSGGGGVGLDAEAARHASGAFRNVPGRARYLLSAIRALVGFRKLRARVSVQSADAQEFDVTPLLVSVLNTPSYGGGVRLAPGASTDDGLLDLVILENLSVLEILSLLPRLFSRGTLKTNQLRRLHVKCVRIETDPPCRFHGDGEILGTTPVEISIVPQACCIIRPRPADLEGIP